MIVRTVSELADQVKDLIALYVTNKSCLKINEGVLGEEVRGSEELACRISPVDTLKEGVGQCLDELVMIGVRLQSKSDSWHPIIKKMVFQILLQNV